MSPANVCSVVENGFGCFFSAKGIAMLVLSRRVGDRILVGDKIIITVVRIGTNATRLGIEADKNTVIVREELVERVPMIQVGVDDVVDLGRRP